MGAQTLNSPCGRLWDRTVQAEYGFSCDCLRCGVDRAAAASTAVDFMEADAGDAEAAAYLAAPGRLQGSQRVEAFLTRFGCSQHGCDGTMVPTADAATAECNVCRHTDEMRAPAAVAPQNNSAMPAPPASAKVLKVKPQTVKAPKVNKAKPR
jgi:hypothetical protein